MVALELVVKRGSAKPCAHSANEAPASWGCTRGSSRAPSRSASTALGAGFTPRPEPGLPTMERSSARASSRRCSAASAASRAMLGGLLLGVVGELVKLTDYSGGLDVRVFVVLSWCCSCGPRAARQHEGGEGLSGGRSSRGRHRSGAADGTTRRLDPAPARPSPLRPSPPAARRVRRRPRSRSRAKRRRPLVEPTVDGGPASRRPAPALPPAIAPSTRRRTPARVRQRARSTARPWRACASSSTTRRKP